MLPNVYVILIGNVVCVFAHFRHANSQLQNILFSRHCTAFYGSQVLAMFNKCMEDMYTVWRIAIHRYGKYHGPNIVQYCCIYQVVCTLSNGFQKDVLNFIK